MPFRAGLEWLSESSKARPKRPRETRTIKRLRYSNEQIAYAVRQAETGTAVADVCRQLGISDATFYVWKKRYANLGATELRELRLLREESAKLMRLVADLSLDK